jgi:hypothetical protein
MTRRHEVRPFNARLKRQDEPDEMKSNVAAECLSSAIATFLKHIAIHMQV